MLDPIIKQLELTEHGFKHIIEAGDQLLKNNSLDHLAIVSQLLKHQSYQARMLATYLLGELSHQYPKALDLLKTKVAHDGNWRVQEMLAKAIDSYCKAIGYQNSLPELERWLDSDIANLNRAVIEGLRIWTGRPYFKEHPQVAIGMISRHRDNDSEYVRRSVGNALRDIAKKHKDLVMAEAENWDMDDVRVKFVYKLITAKK